MSRNFGKVWNCVSTVLVALVVLLAALLAGARLFGLQVFTILSGSMEPKYPVGSLIYVKSVDPSQVKEGDVITFLLSDTVTATHRVVGIVDQGDGALRFRTKGDANDAEDAALVHQNNLLGEPVACIPYLGYFPPGCRTRRGASLPSARACSCWRWCSCPICWAETRRKRKQMPPGMKKTHPRTHNF